MATIFLPQSEKSRKLRAAAIFASERERNLRRYSEMNMCSDDWSAKLVVVAIEVCDAPRARTVVPAG